MRLVEEMQQEHVSFIYNTPNNKSMPGYLKMGWTPVTRIPLWVRPMSPLLRRAFGMTRVEAPGLEGFGTATDVLEDPRLPAFLSDVAPDDDRYHTARTLRYLRWRYADIPTLSYSARFETTGDAGALVIARARRRGYLREVTLSELLVTPSMRGITIARDIVADLVQRASADYVAACAARSSTERQILVRAGFLPAPRLGPHFTVRCLASMGVNPAHWQNWRCSIGDLELF